MSQPVAVSSAICWRVALTSEVSVVVIDWTEIGESLPTPTLPTWIWRVLRRGASTGGGAAGMPRLIAVMAPAYGAARRRPQIRRRASRLEVQGYDDVADDQHHAHHQHDRRHDVGDRQQLGDVDVARGRGGRAAGRTRGVTASQSAPAMWPPSSGSSGMKLNMPMKKLKPAMSISRKTTFSVTGKPVERDRLAGEPAAADDAAPGCRGRAPGAPTMASADAPDLDRQLDRAP